MINETKGPQPPAEAQAQGGGELPSPLNGDFDCPKAAAARSCPCGFCRALRTPSAPVGAAEAWQEGYRQGVLDERASEDNIGIAGFGAKVEPARNNPYAIAQQPAAVEGVAEVQRLRAENHRLMMVCQSAHDRLLRGDEDAALLALLEDARTGPAEAEANPAREAASA